MAKQELDVNNAAADDFFETVDVETLAKQQVWGRWTSGGPEGLASSGRRTRV